mgnify:CR=1 FL=1
MKTPVLVAFASKYGATKEIAERIGLVLRTAGLEDEVGAAGEVKDLSPCRAAVIGSVVCAGQWRKEAASLLRTHEEQLRALPVWLFSSGPLGKGDPETLLRGWRIPKGLVPLIERIGPRDVAVFHGVLKVTKLAWWERALLRMMKVPSGDFRNWTEVKNWAKGIAIALKE